MSDDDDKDLVFSSVTGTVGTVFGELRIRFAQDGAIIRRMLDKEGMSEAELEKLMGKGNYCDLVAVCRGRAFPSKSAPSSGQDKQLQNAPHSTHYKEGSSLEPIEVIEAWGLGFHEGNAIKYIYRKGKKSKAEVIKDIDKAIWYLERYRDKILKQTDEVKP